LQLLLGTGVLGVSGTAMKNLGSLSMPILNREQVLGLAPDPAAAKAGQGQAILAKWQPGASAEAAALSRTAARSL
jgi:hypothetical protein